MWIYCFIRLFMIIGDHFGNFCFQNARVGRNTGVAYLLRNLDGLPLVVCGKRTRLAVRQAGGVDDPSVDLDTIAFDIEQAETLAQLLD